MSLLSDDFAGDTSTEGVIAIGGQISGTIDFEDDADWFAFTAVEGQSVTFDTGFQGLDVAFYDANGNYLEANFETLSVTNLAAGRYYVEVSGFFQGDAYTLSATEFSDDYAGDTTTTGSFVVGDTITGSIDFESDSDWFAFTLGQGEIIGFESDVFTDLSVVDAQGNFLAYGAETLTTAGLDAGDYFLNVTGFETADYTIQTSLIIDDHANTFEDATQIEVGSLTQGRVDYEFDEDVFAVTLTEGKRVEFSADGGVDVTLTDAEGNFIEAIYGFGETISFDVVESGTYFVSVSSFDAGDYTLTTMEQGTDADNILRGTERDDVLNGFAGDDTFIASEGDDTIDGGEGFDTYDASASAEAVTAFVTSPFASEGEVISRVLGDNSFDQVTNVERFVLSDFDDFIRVSSTIEAVEGGEGFDRVSFFNVDATSGVVADLRTQTVSDNGYGGTVALSSIESLGSTIAFADVLDGDDNDNVLTAAGSGDTLRGHGGDDRIFTASGGVYDGGAGTDELFIYSEMAVINTDDPDFPFIDFLNASEAIVVDLASGTIVNDGFGQTGTFSNFEVYRVQAVDGQTNVITGTDGADDVTAYGSANVELFGGNDVFFSNDSSDYSNRDIIVDGGEGNDTLTTAGGNDILIGGSGADVLDGGSGTDYADYTASSAGVAVNLVRGNAGGGDAAGDQLSNIEGVLGSAYGDSLVGNAEDNFFAGYAGNDRMFGGDGNDELAGGDGNDSLTGDAGDDTIFGDAGRDTLAGGEGLDVIYGGEDGDRIFGNDGDDFLYGDSGNDLITGGDGNDSLFGGEGNDSLTGGEGDDVIETGEGIDKVRGGNGDDTITGGSELDSLAGDAGNDTIYGMGGNDRIFGQNGDDIIFAGDGDDAVNGGNDNDTIIGEAGDDSIRGDAGDDIISGGAGEDTLRGGLGDDVIDGGADDDTIVGGKGADRITGGEGVNTILGESGADVFYNTAGGIDVVRDFDYRFDVVEVAGASIEDVAVQAGANVRITTGSGGFIVLAGVDLARLSDANFVFGAPDGQDPSAISGGVDATSVSEADTSVLQSLEENISADEVQTTADLSGALRLMLDETNSDGVDMLFDFAEYLPEYGILA